MPTPTDQADSKGFWRAIPRFLGDNWAYLLGTVMSVVTVIWMLRLTTASAQPLTPHESTLQAVLLTSASIFASWFVSRLDTYFRRDEGLRRLGTQTARGVIVLTTEIDKLVEWINRETPRQAHADNDRSRMVLTDVAERLGTFRSMCIVALGGLSDVIANPLRRYNATLNEIFQLQEEQSTVIRAKITQGAVRGDVAALQQQIDEIRKGYEARISELARKTDLPATTLGQPPSPQLTTRPSGRAPRRGAAAPDGDLVRDALRKKQSYVPPRAAVAFAQLVAAIDQEMHRDGVDRTPKELRRRLEARAESFLTSAKVADAKPADMSKVVGRFFSLVFRGRLFRFGPGAKPGMLVIYENRLTDLDVVETYVRSSLYRVWGHFKFEPEHAPLLNEVLLGGSWNSGEDVVAKAVRDLLAGSIDLADTEQ